MKLLALAAPLLLGACAQLSDISGSEDANPMVSIADLNRTPDAWDGRRVRVEGLLAIHAAPGDNQIEPVRGRLFNSVSCWTNAFGETCELVPVQLAQPLACERGECREDSKRVIATGTVKADWLRLNGYAARIPILTESLLHVVEDTQ